MEHSLYGTEGFFTRSGAGGPISHFRTSATASPLFATAIARLLREVDATLDNPQRLDVVDIGAGRGELLTGVLSAVPESLIKRIRPIAVELSQRPDGLSPLIEWRSTPPDSIAGLLLATEWLDNVPLDLAELTDDGLRYLLVDSAGEQRLGPLVEPDDNAWISAWWPLADSGTRAEIGRTRDEAWARVVARMTRGLAVSVDYGHRRQDRPSLGTLTGYRDGRQVVPVPDGTCDLTAHVAIDSVAQSGQQVAKRKPIIMSQRDALLALGISGKRPPLTLASVDPARYVRALAQASVAAELTDSSDLGAHLWLVQPVGIDAPLRSGTGNEPTAEESARLVPTEMGRKEC